MKTLAELNALHETSERARGFSKWIRATARASRESISPLQALESDRGVDRITKAATAALVTGDLADLLHESTAFVAMMNRRTVLGQLAGALTAPPYVPVATPETDPTPQWIVEGQPIPFARLSFDNPRTSISKYAFIVGFSEELFRLADDRVVSLIERISLRAGRRAEDTLFLSDTAAVPQGNPAGILNGLSAVGAGSPATLTDDVSALWTAVSDGDADLPFFVLSPRGAVYLAALNENGAPLFPNIGPRGGDIWGVPAIVSRAAANKVILIDAANLVITDEGLEARPSMEAAVEMDDAPTPGSVLLVSAFQTNAMLVRFVRYIHWTLLTDSTVAFLELPTGGSPA